MLAHRANDNFEPDPDIAACRSSGRVEAAPVS
jgi:hypothetical protein